MFGFRFLISNLLMLFLWVSTNAEPLRVQSPEDYRIHMAAHRQRLIVLGKELKRNFPERFSNVSEQNIGDWLALHDQSKVNLHPEFLDHFHQQNPEDQIATRLYQQLYGRPISSLPEEEKIEAIALINELNKMDSEIAARMARWLHLIDNNGNESPALQELRYIEKIADIVDRELDPIAAEEFGKKPWPAEEAFPGDLAAAQMISHLRLNYIRLTTGLSYKDLKNSDNETDRRIQFEEAASHLCAVLIRYLSPPTRKIAK